MLRIIPRDGTITAEGFASGLLQELPCDARWKIFGSEVFDDQRFIAGR